MTLTVDQFGKALVASGLMTADELKALWNAIPADARPKQGDGFAKLLVQQGKLNQFQADELLSGRNTPLVMGDYVLVAELGAGGMGKVYKARHRRMERIVALKVMSAAAMQDEAAVKRFQREVKAAARLEHPNIVTAYDSGEAGSVKYLVMQFVDGGDLSQLVKQSGPLEIERAVDYVLQAARGLAFAHGEGVVHRDIKPANLLLDKKGVVKILDMGLARIEGGDGLTATEQVMGTVDYMSPEQAANTKTADGRSDIYSLGCTLWYLLTAKKLYDGDTMISRLMSHRNDPPPSLVKARDDVPWSLEQAFHKMIAKLPEDRFQSMDEVVAALEPFSPSGGSRPGMGSSIGMGPQNAELASFLKSVGPAVKPQTKPAPSGTKVDIEATAQFAAAGADTDPKSQLLPPSKKAAQPQTKGSGKKPPPNKNLLLAAAGGGALLVLLGVWFIFRDKDGNETARVQMPDGGSVTVQQPAATGGPTPVAAATRPAVSFFLPNSTPTSPSGTTSPPPVAPPPAVPSSNGIVYLDDLQEKSYFGLGALEKAGRNPSDVATLSKYFPEASPVHALVVHPETSGLDKHRYAVTSIPRHKYMSRLVYDLEGKYAAFRSGFRVRTGGKDSPHLAEVWGDGKLLWESGDLVPLGVAGATADVDVRGVRELTLIVWGDAGKRAALLTEPRLTLVAPVPPGGSPGVKTAEVDLLPLVDLSQDVLSGQWSRQGSELHSTAVSGTNQKVRLPVDPGEAYSLRVAFAVNRGYPKITLPLESKGLVVAFLADTVELELAGPKGGAANPSVKTAGRAVGDGARHEVKIDVSRPSADEVRIAVAVDGKPTLDWTGTREQLRAVLGPDLPQPVLMFESFQTGATAVQLLEAKLTTTVGAMKPLRGARAAAAGPPPAVFPFDAATALKHQQAWAKHLGEPVETTNSVGMKFVVIPPGQFLMGEKDSKEGEVPVTLTKPFRLSIHEVTREQWRAVVGKDSGFYAADRGENCAANNMNQEEAVEFCQKLTERERTAGTLPLDAAYRLPTEAEWEWACRAGTTTAYSFGEDQALLGQYAWFKGSTGGMPYAWPVGRLKPNLWGLYDMYGNVKERCHDGVQAQLTGGVDPQGTSEGKTRMLRGGAFGADAASCRTGFRSLDTTKLGKDTTIGFRVALSRTGSGVLPQAGTSTTDLGTPPSGSAPSPAVFPFDAATAVKHQEAWARHLGVPVEFTNSVGMKFRLIPPGEFQMGLGPEFTDEELKRLTGVKDVQEIRRLLYARPVHRVRITRPFYMEVEEITSGRYRDVVGQLRPEMEQDPNAVLTHWVAWPDAISFCNRLSEREGKRPAYRIDGAQITPIDDADGYRLPTEAEWEYACRAGTNTLWYFGNDGAGSGIKEFRDRYAVPNPFGLTGLYGGSSEWCWDATDLNPYSASTPGPRDDPREEVGKSRIKRGGSGSDSGGGDRVSINSFVRAVGSASAASQYTGLGRVVLPIAAATTPPTPAEPRTSVSGPAAAAIPPGDSPGAKTTLAAPRWPLAPSKPEDIVWLQGLKATLTLRAPSAFGGGPTDVRVQPGGPLPTGAATVAGIDFGRENFALMTDDVLKRTATLVDLESLSLGFGSVPSAVTKDGLPQLATLVHLRRLDLGRIGPRDTDPVFLERFANLESLKIGSMPFLNWEPHVGRLPALADLHLDKMGAANLQKLVPMTRLKELGLSDYGPAEGSKRHEAAKQYAPLVPWCRITIFGSGNADPRVVIEPTAPPPAAASGTK